jgi:hypothetical protein
VSEHASVVDGAHAERLPALIVPGVRRAAVVLGTAIGAFVVAGATVMAIELLTGSDYLLGISHLLNLNREGNLPAWFSSALLLTAAGLLTVTAVDAPRQVRPRWYILGAVFVLLSVDEAAAMHELLNVPLRAALETRSLLYFPWILAGLSFAALVGLAEWRLLVSLPAAVRRRFLAAGAVYVGGAAGLEAIAAPVYSGGRLPTLHTILIVVEESMEMAGVALFILALLRYLEDRRFHATIRVIDEPPAACAPPDAWHVRRRSLMTGIFVLVTGLAAVSIALQALHHLHVWRMPAAVRLFSVGDPFNVPTWYLASMLLGCGVLFALIGALERHRGPGDARRWRWAALGCLLLSAAEGGRLDDVLSRPAAQALNGTGLAVALIVVTALALLLAVRFRRVPALLPRETRVSLLIAVVLFVLGAFGFVAFAGGAAEGPHARLRLAILTTLAGTAQMIAVAVAARAGLEYLRLHVGAFRLKTRTT